ncbi:MAG: hypothetical protein ABIJ84_01360 [bacterium]
MAEKLRTGEPEKGLENSGEGIGRGLSKIEARDAADSIAGSKWIEGAKGYILGGGKIVGVLLALSALVVLKAVEVSAMLMQGIIENPDKPEKWLEPFKKSFKKDKKEK